MTGFYFGILFGLLTFVFFPCEGKITSPRDGTTLTFPPGSSKNITWAFDDVSAASRTWSFTSSDGLRSGVLGLIFAESQPQMSTEVLPGVNIIKPATLTLSKVDQNYNGTYKFELKVNGKPDDTSDVIVFIAKKPTVTLSCSSPVTVNEGNDLTCECQGQDGNPPANVTWYKDSEQIGETGKEEQTLTRRNVSATDSGTYKCVAESYPDAKFRDEESITVIVKLNYKPNKPVITLPDNGIAFRGESYTITCKSDGLPEPEYSIIHNDTEVSTSKTYTIDVVEYRHAGTYKCVATNSLGTSNSTSANLKVKERGPPKPTSASTSKKQEGNGTDTITDDGDDGGLGVGPIIGIVIGVLVLLVIVIVVVWRYKLKEKDGYRGNSNVDPTGDRIAGNQLEMDDNNAYETVKNEPSGSKSKPPESTLPVYAAVDKNNREGKPLYATLDTVAMNSDGSKRRSEERKPEPTQYASIDFEKSGEVPKADLV